MLWNIFSPDEWNRIPQEEQQRLRQERDEYRESNRRRGTVSQVQAQPPQDHRSVVSEITTAENRPMNPPGSVVTAPSTIMGGRNEVAALRSRNQQN